MYPYQIGTQYWPNTKSRYQNLYQGGKNGIRTSLPFTDVKLQIDRAIYLCEETSSQNCKSQKEKYIICWLNLAAKQIRQQYELANQSKLSEPVTQWTLGCRVQHFNKVK